MMRIVAPFGFYGAGNIGDEATLQGFARVVASSKLPVRVDVGSRDPRHTALVEPSFSYFRSERREWKRRIAERFASAMVVAGGTPIMDNLGRWPLSEVTPLVEDAHRRGQLVAFVGVGTERLRRSESIDVVRERLAPCVRRWTVRSSQDQERLLSYGVPAERVTVTGDMAWLLDPVTPRGGRRRLIEWGISDDAKVIGVNLLGEKAVLENEPRLFEKMAAFLDEVIDKHHAFVLFLSNEVRDGESYDTAAAQATRALMKNARHSFVAPNDYLTPQGMLSLIANCYATVSMRYHFCLFSALQGVPFVALQRSDKVVDLCSDLQWPFGINPSGMSVADLTALFDSLEGRRDWAIPQLGARADILGHSAARNEDALHALEGRSVPLTPAPLSQVATGEVLSRGQ
jgi:polysaccharide pyruvyl transferase WcaK-like protein